MYRALGDHLAGRGKFNDVRTLGLRNKLKDDLLILLQARAVYEKGLELNPIHAPLYHSLAELEARLFNVEGLAQLNKRALKIFNRNALEPAPFSPPAYSASVRSRTKPSLSRSIAVLAEKIVNDEESSEALRTTASSSNDPAATLDTIADNLIEGLLEDI